MVTHSRHDPAAPPHTPFDVGRRIRTLRLLRGMTVRDLATASGVSAGMVSNVENGKTSASIGVMVELCRSLGVELADLFGTTGVSACPTADSEREVLEATGGIRKTVLLREPKFGVSFYQVHIPPGASTGQVNSHDRAIELVHVLHNEVVVYLDDVRVEVRESESTEFKSEINHYIRNESDTPAVFQWLVVTKGK